MNNNKNQNQLKTYFQKSHKTIKIKKELNETTEKN